MSDPRLVVAWLLLLHLIAEYVLRPDPGRGRPSGPSLAIHGLVAAVCFAPAAAAFGTAGAAVLAVAVGAHLLLDGLEQDARRETGPGTDALRTSAQSDLSLGPAWTARPAARAALVQGIHVAILFAAWRLFLADAAPTQAMVDLARNVTGSAAPADFHRAVLVAVIAAAIVIVDVVAAARFVGLLLRPWGSPERFAGATGAAAAVEDSAARPARGWRIQLGPLSGRVVPEPTAAQPAGHPAVGRPATSPAATSPAAVGRAIGVFERLLITMLVLAQAEAAVALVVGVKTVARYRQLDDRSFAEYYLLGTLASVLIGIGAGLLARLALA